MMDLFVIVHLEPTNAAAATWARNALGGSSVDTTGEGEGACEPVVNAPSGYRISLIINIMVRVKYLSCLVLCNFSPFGWTGVAQGILCYSLSPFGSLMKLGEWQSRVPRDRTGSILLGTIRHIR